VLLNHLGTLGGGGGLRAATRVSSRYLAAGPNDPVSSRNTQHTIYNNNFFFFLILISVLFSFVSLDTKKFHFFFSFSLSISLSLIYSLSHFFLHLNLQGLLIDDGFLFFPPLA